MKYSNWIGIVLIGVLLWACNMVWITVPPYPIEVGGFHSKGYDEFGRPGLMHLYLCIPAAIMFIIPRLWAKRTNVFLTGMNMAWGIRNFYLIGVLCKAGECPEKQVAIYIVLAASILIFIMAVFPKLEIKSSQ